MITNLERSTESIIKIQRLKMASNIPEETISREAGSREPSAGEGQTKVKHRFSEPWEDSDLILVVEDEKFHVHRLILSMNSPVFKAMFKSQFKEATSKEIPLPEKKASEVLDLLKLIYFKHVIQEPVEITMLNVEHLLKLSDEYEIKHVFESCVSFVVKQPKLKQNVMKLRKMAVMYNLKSVLEGCEDFLENLKLKTLREIVDFKDLDRDTLQHFLEQRIERLEKFVDQVYPEYMAVLEYVMEKQQVDVCKEHISKGKFKSNRRIDSEVIRRCQKCWQQISCSFEVVTSSYQQKYRHKEGTPNSYFFPYPSTSCSINDFYVLKNG